VYDGARKRYGELTEEIRTRIDYGLDVICRMGFAGYFLIVWDLIRFARESGIRVGPGRGSAAGSVVSYSLRITDLDPLRYGLIFERFLNPERKQMPDIDMDFDERRRDEVIRYVAAKYGTDRVAQIITFQTIKGKQGIRDAARVLGYPASIGDRLCKMYPPAVLGREKPIVEALKESHELADAYEKEPEAREIVDTARALERLRREDTVKLLRRKGIELDIDHVPLDDEPTYEMLRRGDTTAVFQLEGGGMRSLIKALAPDRFEDIMALNALYRPGPLGMGTHVEYAEL